MKDDNLVNFELYRKEDKASPLEIVEVGDFVVDFLTGVVISKRGKGEERSISKNLLELLRIFLEDKSDSYLSSKEIKTQLYQDHVVTDDALRQQISSLRKVFDDSEKIKRYIATKPGQGYKLIASFTIIDKEQSVEEVINRRNFSPTTNSILGGISVILLAILAIYALSQPTNQSSENQQANIPQQSTQLKPLTHLKGLELYAAPSSDGRWLAFSHSSVHNRNWQIYLRDLQNKRIVALTDSSLSHKHSQWSPDGSKLLFTRMSKDSCQFVQAKFDANLLKLVDEVVLLDCPTAGQNARAEYWTDGKGLYYNAADSVTEPYKMYSHSFEANKTWQISSPPPSGKGDHFFKLSGDGKYIAVLRDKYTHYTDIWLYDTNNWEMRLVDTVNTRIMTIDWSFDSQSLIYKNASNQIVKTDIKNGSKVALFRASEPIYAPVLIDKKNLKVAVIKGGIRTNEIISVDLESQKISPLANSSSSDFLPTTSGNGEKLAWISNRTGVYQIWFHDKSDGYPTQLSELAENIRFRSLSFNQDGSLLGGTADGRWFIYDFSKEQIQWGKREGFFDTFEWRTTSNHAFVTKNVNENWLLFELDTSNFTLTQLSELNDAYLIKSSYNPDEVYLSKLGTPGIFRLNLETGVKKAISTSAMIHQSYHWSRNNKGLYFTHYANRKNQLYFVENSSSTPTLITEDFPSRTVALAFDEQLIVTTKNSFGDTDIVELN